MSVEAILMMLEGVRSSGTNRWRACCPVHGGGSGSLSLKECSDGTVLINCFACGASAMEVAESVGVSVNELFPPDSGRPTGPSREQRATIETDKVVMMIYEADKRGGRQQSLADFKRYRLAQARHAAMTSRN